MDQKPVEISLFWPIPSQICPIAVTFNKSNCFKLKARIKAMNGLMTAVCSTVVIVFFVFAMAMLISEGDPFASPEGLVEFAYGY